MPSVQVTDHHNQFLLFKGPPRMLSCETHHTVHQGHAKGMDGKAQQQFLTTGMFQTANFDRSMPITSIS
jgi:hypothetical protein